MRVSDVATVQPGTLPVYTVVTRKRQARGAAQHHATARQQHGRSCRRSRCRSRTAAKKLPAGRHLAPYYDQSELVRESIKSVRDAILIGLVLACIILFLFLRDWSSSLVAGLVIPVTIAVTILFL